MDPTQDGTTEDRVRVTEIRREVDALRLRIAETIDALEYKADVGSRLGDKLSATASSVTARVRQSLPSSSRKPPEAQPNEEEPA